MPNCVSAEIQVHLVETVLRQFRIVSLPKVKSISTKLFQDTAKVCLRRNSSVSHRNYPSTIPNSVLVEVQMHPIENIPRQFQIVSEPKFICIWPKLFWDNAELCLSRNSFSSHGKYSMTIPSCVLAKIRLHLNEIFLRQFHIASKSKFNCTLSKIFFLWKGQFVSEAPVISFMSSKLFKRNPYCVLAEIQFHLVEIVLRQFQKVSEANTIASHRNYSKTIPYCFLAEVQLHFLNSL